MANFEAGDILEIAHTSNQKFPTWVGLTIEVSSSQARLVIGKVLKSATPDKGYPVGSKISWCEPGAFTYAQAKIKRSKKDKYLSPFSGRWE